MIDAKKFTVSGKVQGVWFRQSTMQVANTHKLSGWVRNLENGSVEVVAAGNEFALKQLEKWLKQGPTHARVDKVNIETISIENTQVFEIR